jgi:hypothetical protein
MNASRSVVNVRVWDMFLSQLLPATFIFVKRLLFYRQLQ